MPSTISAKRASGAGSRAPEVSHAGHAGLLDASQDPAPVPKSDVRFPDLPAFLNRREPVPSGFDYGQLAPSVASMLKERAIFIRGRIAQTAELILETGAALLGVKEKLDHGQFTDWVETELNINIRTAQRYMSVAVWVEGKNDIVSLLTPSTLYRISAKSVPAEATQAVLDLIRSATPVTDDRVDFIIKETQRHRREARQNARIAHRRSKKERNRREAEQQRAEQRRRADEEKSRAKAREIVSKFGADDARFILDAFRADLFLSQFLAEELEAQA